MLTPMITSGAMPGMLAPSMVAAPAATSVMPASVATPPGVNAFVPAAVTTAAPAAARAASSAVNLAPTALRNVTRPPAPATPKPSTPTQDKSAPLSSSPTPELSAGPVANTLGGAGITAAQLQERFSEIDPDLMAEGTALGIASGVGGKLFMVDGLGRIGAHAVRIGPGNIGTIGGNSVWSKIGRSARTVADTTNASLWASQDTSLNNLRALPANFFKTALHGPVNGGVQTAGHAAEGGALNATDKYKYSGLTKHSADGWFTKRVKGWEKALTPAAASVTDAATKSGGFWDGVASAVGNALQPYGNWRAGHKEASATKQHAKATAKLEKLFAREAEFSTGMFGHAHDIRTELAKGAGKVDVETLTQTRNKLRGALAKGGHSFIDRRRFAYQIKGIEKALDKMTHASSAARGFSNITDSVRAIPGNIGKMSLLDAGIRGGMGLEAAVQVRGVQKHISHALSNFSHLVADVEGISPKSVNATSIILGEARRMAMGGESPHSPIVQQAAHEMLASYGPEAISAAISTWAGSKIMLRGFSMLPLFVDMGARKLIDFGKDTPHMLNAYEALRKQEATGKGVEVEEIAYLIASASPEAGVAGPESLLVQELAGELKSEGKSVLDIMQLINDKPAFLARTEAVEAKIIAQAEADLAAYDAQQKAPAPENTSPTNAITAAQHQEKLQAPTRKEVMA